MLNIINDYVTFSALTGGGRTITRDYNTFPYRVYQASVALQGIDYGFSDDEGPFFRCTITTSSQILSPYIVRVTTVFGFRSRQFDRRTDATINYAVLIQQI
jgi:hypothetical protein